MKHLNWIITIFLCLIIYSIKAQNVSDSIALRTYQAALTATPPAIDGILDDECWENAGEWSGTFTQQMPNEGQPETEKTQLKILYDHNNIYVAFRAFDSEPDKINRWLVPRDQSKGDYVMIYFDSYADKRTTFAFGLTAGGTRFDFTGNNELAWDTDLTWNAVWDGKVSHDNQGWYAEIRIPFSQLRYSENIEQEWGFHALRLIDRKKETVHLHLIPQMNTGFVFSFGTLTGMSNLPKSRRIELSPYTTLKFRSSEKIPDNPYATGTEWNYGAGLDGKIGLSSNFTLDFTFNPDFGQVEADPSTINLTAFETYYSEKRQFFLEGKNIFDLVGGSSMFYSRRIGSPPRWRPGSEYGQYSSVPQQTNIISAIKVSGKNKQGLSVGLLNSVTAPSKAKIMQDGHEYKMTAQPLVSYSIARVQQDINKGNTIIGGMLTSANRSLKDDHLSFLSRNAYTGAVDFAQYFRNREYYAMGYVLYSYITGSQDAMIALQQSPTHYYQREGAPHLSVDSLRTNLQGNAGKIILGRGGENKFVSEQVLEWASPGFDPNDMGYLQNADYKMFRGYINYVENTPKGILRKYNVALFYRCFWDYGNTNTYGISGFDGNVNFTNNWGFYWGGFYEFRNVENSMLRGGPPVRLNPRWGTDLNFWTDNSKKVVAQFYHGTMLGDKRYGHYAWSEVNYRPIPNLGISGRVNFTYSKLGLEYTGQQVLDTGKKVYLMGALRQDILGFTFRADYSITPELSVQFYGNPFMSSGKYTKFKRATNTMDKTYENRFYLLQHEELSYNASGNTYSASETATGYNYTFYNPDFSFREFRSNLVIRWEYKPNSIIYLVWAQGRSGRVSEYVNSFLQNTKALFNYYPDNTIMVKFNYWFSI